jgi:hypothetical protein
MALDHTAYLSQPYWEAKYLDQIQHAFYAYIISLTHDPHPSSHI